MRYTRLITICVLTILTALNSYGQDANSIFPNLYGQEALDSIIVHFKPNQVLNYSNARDYLYGTVYNENDSVECVYSGHKLHLPEGVDPSIHLFQNGSNDGINCEHTFPRSKGADKENGNAFSDMHHLFPTRSKVNSGRENFPYAEIEDEESTHWYYQNIVKAFMPTTNIDLYSERVNGWFEPREEHKGNAARAMFYFYTMYKKDADQADSDFFEIQKKTLCQWNQIDPVDEKELMRTGLIADRQDGLSNPFVLDTTLANRCYCDESTTSIFDVEELKAKSISVYPNPMTESNLITFESSIDRTLRVRFFNVLGSQIAAKHLQKGLNSYVIPENSDDMILYSIIDPISHKIIESGIISKV